MYPFEEQQALQSLQDTLDENDESQIVKRKPNNNRFFLKGMQIFGVFNLTLHF